MNKILTFYGTVGNPQETTLKIDRTGFLDLSYLFKYFFSSMGDGFGHYWNSERWKVDEKTAVARFNLNKEFFRNLLGRYGPTELADFIEEHLKDKEDFHNETLIKKLRSFDDNYERIYYYNFSKNYFFLKPMSSDRDYFVKKVKEIESIFEPNHPRHISRDDTVYYIDFRDRIKKEYSLNKGERGITRPYRKNSFSEVFEKLNEKLNKPLFPVSAYFRGPKLDYFSIIKCCDEIPLNHLKLARKS